MINEFLRQIVFQNKISEYVTAAGTFVVGLIIFFVLERIFFRRFKQWALKTETSMDDFVVKAIEKRLLPLVLFGLFYMSIQILKLKPGITQFVDTVGLVLLIIIGVRLVLAILNYSVANFLLKRKDMNLSKQQAIKVIMPVVKFIIWVLAGIIGLDNLGVKISALMAGLGIGGVAVALASQTVLGDVFNYFTIFFDRPFELGDFIVIGEFAGTVEHIGIKTTRIRSLGGEQLVFSNTDLSNSRVRNYKRMEQRRVLFKFNITYDTPLEQIQEIPGVVRRIIENLEETLFDRAHFASFGDSALVFENAYYVLSSDFNYYMDIQQQINLNLMKEFRARGISFAFPT
ncbi:MAG TPA: mechanosensitive ion channel protein MscS, partial [Firmicutes bacterium]|nr:mechanosensitive ion channel protein MscS [Bacillota bacterium]